MTAAPTGLLVFVFVQSAFVCVQSVLAILWQRRFRFWRRQATQISAVQYETQDQLTRSISSTETAVKLVKELKATLVAQTDDADRLAICVSDYIHQMDEFSTKRCEPPCALTRERAALSLHNQLKESISCPRNRI